MTAFLQQLFNSMAIDNHRKLRHYCFNDKDIRVYQINGRDNPLILTICTVYITWLVKKSANSRQIITLTLLYNRIQSSIFQLSI